MTDEQIARIVAITDKDCLGRQTLCDKHGHTCAVGALMVAAGMDIEAKQRIPTQAQLVDLYAIYGLTKFELWDMIGANDEDSRSLPRRRAAVRALVEGWAKHG